MFHIIYFSIQVVGHFSSHHSFFLPVMTFGYQMQLLFLYAHLIAFYASFRDPNCQLTFSSNHYLVSLFEKGNLF